MVVFHSDCTQDQVSLFNKLFVLSAKEKINQILGQNIPITLVMINTKTSERFFRRNGDRIENVEAGTLINQDVVSENYEFFLVSQKANKGTAVPNHYRVIYSDSKMQEGYLQEIIFSQCFAYFNWSGSIKVPAILQYAKKAAKFFAEVMVKVESPSVPDSLKRKYYYI